LSSTSTRVNLAIPIDAGILMEKECDKRGIKIPQFIKEAVYEKLKRSDKQNEANELQEIKSEIQEIKSLLMLLVNVQSKN